jgi:hypothetical protein
VSEDQIPSEWQYTIRIGYGDESDKWVAQIFDDTETEVHVCVGETIGEAVGSAAAAIMDVHDTDSHDLRDEA